jgi:hypothetical protein
MSAKETFIGLLIAFTVPFLLAFYFPALFAFGKWAFSFFGVAK